MLRVVSLGLLISDVRYINSGSSPYPVGYSIEVPVFATPKARGRGAAPKVLFPDDEADHGGHVADVYYTASIRQGLDGGPLFEVIRSDKPDRPHQGDKPSKPWRDAFEAAERDFPDMLSSLNRPTRVNGYLQIYGIKWFGLSNAQVVERIKKLPGAASAFSEVKTNMGTEESEEEQMSGVKKEKGAKMTRGGLTVKKGLTTKKSSPVSKEADKNVSAKRPRGRPSGKQIHTNFTIDGNTNNKDDDDDDDDDDDELVISAYKSTPSVSSPASPVFPLCPLCGLAGTPFCASTGKPHSAGKKARVVRSTKNTTTTPGMTEKSDSIENTGKPEGPKRQKRSRGSPDTGEPGSSSGVDGQPMARRAKREKTQSASSETGRGKKRQHTIDEFTKKRGIAFADNDDDADEPSLADIMRQKMREEKNVEKTSPPPPPLWRPPLDSKESYKAGVVLQRILRAEPSLQAPFANLLRVPMAPIRAHPVKGEKKMTGTTLKKKNGTRKSGAVEDEGEKDEDEEDDEEKGEQQQERQINNGDGTDGVADTKTVILPEEKNIVNKQELRKEKHPLEIIDPANSIPGKRYVRFMQMYTSERTKLDLLKKSDSVLPVPRGPQVTRDAARAGAKKESAAHPVAEDPVTEVEG